MLGLVHVYDVFFNLLLGGKNLGTGAAEEVDKREVIQREVDHDVLLHHHGVVHLLLILLHLLLFSYTT